MSNKSPTDDTLQKSSNFVGSLVHSAQHSFSKVERYLSKDSEENLEQGGMVGGLLQKELVRPLKGIGKYFIFDFFPGLKKIGRGALGVVLAPIVATVGAFTGIPPTEVNTLIGGLNTAEGIKGLWGKFKSLSKKHGEAFKKMSAGNRAFEIGKRILSIPLNPIMGAISGFFNTALANVLGGAFTILGGLGRLQKKLKKESTVFNLAQQYTPIGKIAELGGNVSQTLETIVNTSNMWGRLAATVAKWGWVQKILSPKTIELWKAYGNDLLIAATNGDKEAIYNMVKQGVKSTIGEKGEAALDQVATHAKGFAKRLGASEYHLTQIQRLAKGDIGVLREVVQQFVPGFEIKDAKSLWNFTSSVKQTFNNTIKDLASQYVPGADFEKVSVKMTDLLGFKAEAFKGVKAKLGGLGEKALSENFETIRAKGSKMVQVANDFVNQIGDKNLRAKMGYTLAAGNKTEALKALIDQKATPDFIQKIHTFVLKNPDGTESSLGEEALATFKNEAIRAARKISNPTLS